VLASLRAAAIPALSRKYFRAQGCFMATRGTEDGGCGRRAASRAGNYPQGHLNISLAESIRHLCRKISPKSLKAQVKCKRWKWGSDSLCLMLIPALVQSGTKAVPHFASSPGPPELWSCLCCPLLPQEGDGNAFPLVPPPHPGESPWRCCFSQAKVLGGARLCRGQCFGSAKPV